MWLLVLHYYDHHDYGLYDQTAALKYSVVKLKATTLVLFQLHFNVTFFRVQFSSMTHVDATCCNRSSNSQIMFEYEEESPEICFCFHEAIGSGIADETVRKLHNRYTEHQSLPCHNFPVQWKHMVSFCWIFIRSEENSSVFTSVQQVTAAGVLVNL